MRVAALLAAVLIDRLFGEPRLHPVRLMGGFLAGAGRRHRRSEPGGDLVDGLVTLGIGTVASAAGALALTRGASRADGLAGAALRGALLKPSFSLEELLNAGERVAAALEQGRLETARRLVGRDLVSRDTLALPAHLVASAAIESMAENLVDSFVAPLMYYLAAGAPAAYAYRFANTADAMFGYRTRDLEWFGKPFALWDDALNLAPARISALALSVGGRGRPTPMGRIAREARKTTSPNAGWPMATVALRLDVRLQKIGGYVLNPEGRAPAAAHVRRAAALVRRTAYGVVAACALGAAMLGAGSTS